MVKSKEELEKKFHMKHNNLSSGGHILYVYDDERKYVDNLFNYIVEGLENKEHIIVFESDVRVTQMQDRIKKHAVAKHLIDQVIFLKEDWLYENQEQSYDLFTNLADQYIQNEIPLRTWGNVKVGHPEKTLTYESDCNDYICKQQFFCVCAYNGREISATLLTKLLTVHEYFMTDDSLVPSSYFHHNPKSVPSITEQIKLERRAENELLRSEQLTFAGQFAAGICHEIRNPLTTIKGFFQLLKEDNLNDMYYQVIEKELDRIQQITSELLLLAKPHSEEREHHNLAELVNEVIILLESQAIMKSIIIETNIHEEDLIIDCEDTKIKQVIINVVKNAIEIMNKGTITVEVGKKDRFAQLKIKDEGPGIPRDVIDKIGQPFFTTKKEGTGLGLIISFNIIKSHGGTVEIDSEEGKGTIFTFSLPLI
ncbi:ATP-binding protein [Aquibacillus koreensis]|uniref:histidine kinase n=1 Tax=Aquibacillus koreensis TaxID=279446 RepID=A0A9X3WMU7_9BACI|nr:ATP-binding protein [Aquibacillus koreensis]MCT2535755.1 ATP-binding protein [Aquibacillus koreensis]MDC3420211.1 ATP-binding protein [Aquibacillus koreensis]